LHTDHHIRHHHHHHHHHAVLQGRLRLSRFDSVLAKRRQSEKQNKMKIHEAEIRHLL
jgi:hypothetical protein